MATNHTFSKTVIINASKDMVLEFYQNLFNDPGKKKNYSNMLEGGDSISFRMTQAGLFNKAINTDFDLTFGDSSGRTRLSIRANSEGDAEKAIKEMIKELEKKFHVAG